MSEEYGELNDEPLLTDEEKEEAIRIKQTKENNKASELDEVVEWLEESKNVKFTTKQNRGGKRKMKKYRTFITLEVYAENEDEAIRKMYEIITSGEVRIDSLMEVKK